MRVSPATKTGVRRSRGPPAVVGIFPLEQETKKGVDCTLVARGLQGSPSLSRSSPLLEPAADPPNRGCQATEPCPRRASTSCHDKNPGRNCASPGSRRAATTRRHPSTAILAVAPRHRGRSNPSRSPPPPRNRAILHFCRHPVCRIILTSTYNQRVDGAGAGHGRYRMPLGRLVPSVATSARGRAGRSGRIRIDSERCR